MAMCMKCQKEVEYGEPKFLVNETYADIEQQAIGINIEMTLTCRECGEKLKSYTFDEIESFDFEDIQHEDDCPCLLEESDEEYQEESYSLDYNIEGTYAPSEIEVINTKEADGTYWGFCLPVTVKCEYCEAGYQEDQVCFEYSVSESEFE